MNKDKEARRVIETHCKITFINNCGCIVDLDLLERAVLWRANGRIVQSIRHIELMRMYPAIRIFSERITIHKLIMSYLRGGDYPRSLHVHHIDRNKLNASVNNLEFKTASAHISDHLKGVPLSAEHRAKISKAGTKRKGFFKERFDLCNETIMTMYKEGIPVNHIAKRLNAPWSTIKERILLHDEPKEGTQL